MIFLRDDKKKSFEMERENSEKQKSKFARFPIPPFDIGPEYLGIPANLSHESTLKAAGKFVDGWFKDPAKYLKLKNEKSVLRRENGFLSFNSSLDPSKTTRFTYHPQPEGTPGRTVALIHVMHWNGRLNAYEKIIRFIRGSGLPITTLVHVPAGRGLNPGEGDPVDYSAVSPNLGRTVFQAREDILDLQRMAKHLKEDLGYEQVGLFSYSLGSLRSLIAALTSPELFDFAILHEIADNFTEALMNGIATHHVADLIKGNIDYGLLDRLWSTISPGAYQNHFKRLPPTRIVQAKYDLVFGPENNERLNEKIRKERTDVEIQVVPTGHTTFGTLPSAADVMWKNLKFIYRNTNMRKYRRSRFFL
jgi:pimeloyl-ACP methyl ester carboxylesterase